MNRETIIEIETTITYETYKKFLFLNLFKGKPYIKRIIFFYVLIIWAIVMPIISYGFNFFSLILIILCIMTTYMGLTLPKKSYNKIVKKLSKPIKYRFFQDYFNVESNTEDINGLVQINYGGIQKIYETDKALYIYKTNASACILEKKDFDSETLKFMRVFLQSKLGNKYFKDFTD